MKKNKLGFTLIEMMGVLVIISLIAILTFPSIVNQINKSKKTNSDNINSVIIAAAKKYVADNPSEFEDNKYCLTINMLLDNDYLKDDIFNDSDILDMKIIQLSLDKSEYKIVDKNKCSTCKGDYCDDDGNSYTEIEYLESTGQQYIDTEYYNNMNTKVDITFMYLNSNEDLYSNGMIYGSANNLGVPSMSVGLTKDNKLYYRNSDNNELFSNYSIQANRKYNAKFFKTKIVIDNIEYEQSMGLISGNATYSSYLFARHQPGYVNYLYAPFIGRIYTCKIYDGDILVRDYVPVIDNKNIPCLYDKLNEKCYYNKGFNRFIHQEREKVEYLESTGTQYIDTGYYNNPNTKVDITFMYLNSNGDLYSNGMIYGSANNSNGVPSLSIGIKKDNNFYYRNSDTSQSFTNYLINQNQKINVITYKNSIFINGNEYNSNMGIISNNTIYPSYLFARNNQGTVFSILIGRIYSCKIYDGDILVRDYVAMVYNGRPCLYDKVEKKCYYNQGTGEFLYG